MSGWVWQSASVALSAAGGLLAGLHVGGVVGSPWALATAAGALAAAGGGIWRLARRYPAPAVVPASASSSAVPHSVLALLQSGLQDHPFLARLIDAAPVAVTVKDAAGRFVYVNNFAARRGDKKPADLLGRTPIEVYGETPYALNVMANDRRVVETGRGLTFFDAQVTMAEALHDVKTAKVPLRDGSGAVTHVLTLVIDVTEEKQAQRELRRLQRELDAVVENIPGNFFRRVMHKDGSVALAYVRGRLFRDLGLDEAAHSLTKYVIPEDVAVREAAIRRSAETLERCEFEVRIKLPDGRIRWLHSTSRPRRALNGEIVWDGFVLDTTARRLIEEALHDANRRLQSFVNNLPGCIYRRVMTLNGAYRLQYHEGRLVKEVGIDGIEPPCSRSHRIHPEDQRLRDAAIRDSARSLSLCSYEYRVTTPDGRQVWLESISYPQRRSDGSVVWDGLLLDVTQRKHAEHQLRDAEAKFANIADNLPGVVFRRTVLPDGREVENFYAGRLAREFGIDENGPHRGRRLLDFALPDDRIRADEIIRESAASLLPCQVTYRIQTEGGTMRWFQAMSVPRLYEDDSIVSDGFVMEVTRERLADEEMQRSRQKLIEAIEAMGDAVVLFDADERLTYYNAQYLQLYRPFGIYPSVGETFADILERDVEHGIIVSGIKGREREWVEQRLAGFRAQTGQPQEIRLSNGTWLHLQERRTFDGGTIMVYSDITELKTAEEDLRHNEARLRGIIETAADGVVLTDANGNILSFNTASERMFGYDRGEVLGENVRLLMPDAEGSPNEAAVRRYLERDSGRVRDIGREIEGRRKDGSVFPVELSVGEAKQGDERIFIGIVRDITSRKRAEEELRTSEERFRDFTLSTSDWLWETNEALDLTYIAEAGEYALGVPPQTLLGKRLMSLHLSGYDDDAEWKQLFRTLSRHRPFREITCVRQRPSGEIRYLRLSGRPVFDRTGRFVGYRGTGTDVTEDRIAEQRLHHLATIIEATDDAVIGCSLAGEITSWSPGAELIYGHAEDDILGQPIAGTIAEARVEEFEEFFAGVKAGGAVRRMETLASREDGTSFDVSLNMAPVYDADGVVTSIAIVGRDVTDQKRAEQERLRLERQVLQSEKLRTIGTLAGGIAHDFNNILTPIIGYGRLALDETPVSSQVHSDIERVVKGAERARELVKQILAFSRRGKGEERPVAIGDLIEEAVGLLHQTVPANVELRRPLPDEKAVVRGDAVQLLQVIVNLAKNGLQAMEPAGGTLEISVMTEDEHLGLDDGSSGSRPHILIRVRDTGVGMDEKTQDRIFEPFFTTKEIGKGTGMGLAAVHGIVANHGGDILVESALGEGTTFNVFLPADTEARVEDAAVPRGAAPTGTERILVIDDEPEIAALLRRLLSDWGYAVTLRTDPKAALRQFKKAEADGSYDLVITDQAMPGMSGIELTDRLLAIRPTLPVLLVSGYGELIDPAQVADRGLAGYLQKPITDDVLAHEVRRILDCRPMPDDIATPTTGRRV